VPVPADATDSSVEQLLKSAERLEAAGSKDQAERVRREARERAVRDNALARKESELECLVEEIDQLRNLSGQSRTVLIRVVALEFSRAALGEQAHEFDEILGRVSVSRRQKTDSPKPVAGKPHSAPPAATEKPVHPAAFSANPGMTCSLVDEHPLSSTFVHQLLEKKLITVLAEPMLVTVSGKSASFLSGGEFPIKTPQPGGGVHVQMVRFGVQLDARPTVLADRMIRVQANFNLKEPDFSIPIVLGGERVPGLSSRGVNTQVELRSGQTAVLGRLVSRPAAAHPAAAPETVEQVQQTSPAQKPDAQSAGTAPDQTTAERELVVLITAELMNARRTLPALQPIPAGTDNDTDTDAVKNGVLPSFVPDDLQYFPATPVPRKGTLR
jgi:hypothetical protein